MTKRASAFGARIFEASLLLLLLSVSLKLTGDLPWSWAVILAPACVPVLAFVLGMTCWIVVLLLRHLPAPPAESAVPAPRTMTVRQAFASRALTESLTGSR
jgi:hypothetical protein